LSNEFEHDLQSQGQIFTNTIVAVIKSKSFHQ